MKKKVYLAIPYSWNPDVSHTISNRVAAELMMQGKVVFSPISHSHCIADHLPPGLKTDWEWWMDQDLPMVEWADELCVVVPGENGYDLVRDSKGVQKEIQHAIQCGKFINWKEVKL